MRVELVTRREDLSQLTPRWDELAQEDRRDGFFRTSGWYRAWMDHIRPDAEPFVIVVRNGSGEIVGLAPLCRARYRDLGFRLDSIGWAGRESVSGDFLDFVAASGDRSEVIASVLEFLTKGRLQAGLLIFSELIQGGESYRALKELGRQSGIPLRSQEERICPYIELPSTFDEYLNGLSSSSRYHIRRRIRDFEKIGAKVEVYSEGPEMVSGLETLIRLHLTRWRKDNLPGTLARPGFASFLRQICTHPPAGSSCLIYQLNCEGVPVAALLAFRFCQSMLYYQAGWDPDSPLAAQSPGVVVMARSVRDAIEQRLSYYEFLRGDEAYKSRWAKSHRKTTTVLLARSFLAKQYLLTARLKDRVKQLLFSETPRAIPLEEAAVGTQRSGDPDNASLVKNKITTARREPWAGEPSVPKTKNEWT